MTGCVADNRELRPVSVDTERCRIDTMRYIEYDTFDIAREVIDTINHIDTLVSRDGVIGKPTKYLAIHCTASRPSSQMLDITTREWWRRNRGWNKPGYHIVFFRNGEVKWLVKNFRLDGIMEKHEIVNGVQGLNSFTISASYVGGCAEHLHKRPDGRLQLVAEDNITDKQAAAMRGFIMAVKSVNPNIKVGGHRDFRAWMKKPYKACPSFEVSEKFGDVIGTNLFTYE